MWGRVVCGVGVWECGFGFEGDVGMCGVWEGGGLKVLWGVCGVGVWCGGVWFVVWGCGVEDGVGMCDV